MFGKVTFSPGLLFSKKRTFIEAIEQAERYYCGQPHYVVWVQLEYVYKICNTLRCTLLAVCVCLRDGTVTEKFIHY